MIAGTVWTQLVSTLQNNPTLAEYIKFVYEGQRWDIEPESLPCIMLEPTGNYVSEKEMNEVQDVYLNIDLFAFSSSSITDFKKTIVGTEGYKGILDIENDIRACLSSSYTLGGRVIDTRLDPTVFGLENTDKHPVRGMKIPLRILYRQTDNL